MLNPYLSVANQAYGQMRAILVEFGMTPSSRSRVSAAEPQHPTSPYFD